MGGKGGETAQNSKFATVGVAGERPQKGPEARAGSGGSGGLGANMSLPASLRHLFMLRSHTQPKEIFLEKDLTCVAEHSKIGLLDSTLMGVYLHEELQQRRIRCQNASRRSLRLWEGLQKSRC